MLAEMFHEDESKVFALNYLLKPLKTVQRKLTALSHDVSQKTELSLNSQGNNNNNNRDYVTSGPDLPSLHSPDWQRDGG